MKGTTLLLALVAPDVAWGCTCPSNFKHCIGGNCYSSTSRDAQHNDGCGGYNSPRQSCSEDGPCFPSTATVTKADGTLTQVDALKEGDMIVAATDDGTLTIDTVSILSVALPEAEADFITLATTANMTITLTREHHVPFGPKCCTTLKMAKHVSVGETVWTLQGGVALPTTITAMRKAEVKAAGLYSPVLVGGSHPVVDGVVTSFDSIEKVSLAKYGLKPLLATCKATGTCEQFRSLFYGADAKYLG